MASPELGYQVMGFVDAVIPTGSTVSPGQRVLGTLAEVVEVAGWSGAESVLIASSAMDTDATNQLTRWLCHAGVRVEITSTLYDIAPERLEVRPLGRFPTVSVEPAQHHGWRAAAKRAFDLIVASITLVLLTPAIAIIAILVKVTSPGPAFFSQERVGVGGKRFRLYKFRTMVDEAEHLLIDLREHNEADGPLFKIQNDPRVTPLGRVLRALSLDEIPQLWNVVCGDMSLVGPRPALPVESEQWAPEVHQRLKVRPGVTGMWQVNGRSSASFEDYVRLDLYYVDNWSLWTDMAILAKTLPTVLARQGAY